MPSVVLDVRQDVPLAPLSTLGVGGPARHYGEARDTETLREGLRWAAERGAPGAEGHVHVRAGAGEEWDPLVQFTVERGGTGLECHSGMPGRVGATPIQ